MKKTLSFLALFIVIFMFGCIDNYKNNNQADAPAPPKIIIIPPVTEIPAPPRIIITPQ